MLFIALYQTIHNISKRKQNNRQMIKQIINEQWMRRAEEQKEQEVWDHRLGGGDDEQKVN